MVHVIRPSHVLHVSSKHQQTTNKFATLFAVHTVVFTPTHLCPTFVSSTSSLTFFRSLFLVVPHSFLFSEILFAQCSYVPCNLPHSMRFNKCFDDKFVRMDLCLVLLLLLLLRLFHFLIIIVIILHFGLVFSGYINSRITEEREKRLKATHSK